MFQVTVFRFDGRIRIMTVPFTARPFVKDVVSDLDGELVNGKIRVPNFTVERI